MKYFEYVWLASAVLLCIFLIREFEHFKLLNFAIILVGIIVSVAMYSFRRNLRIKMEKKAEEMLEQESGDESETETP